jgi:hypothetical protein
MTKEQNRARAVRLLCGACLQHFDNNEGEVIIDELCVPCREKCIRHDVMQFTSEED